MALRESARLKGQVCWKVSPEVHKFQHTFALPGAEPAAHPNVLGGVDDGLDSQDMEDVVRGAICAYRARHGLGQAHAWTFAI